jgi:hypothetical protein
MIEINFAILSYLLNRGWGMWGKSVPENHATRLYDHKFFVDNITISFPRRGPAITSMSSPTNAEVSAVQENAEEPVVPLQKVVFLQDQSSRMPPKKLALVTISLILAIFLTSFEQVSVSTTLPGIAKDFGTSTSISWVGTAFLVAKFDLDLRS